MEKFTPVNVAQRKELDLRAGDTVRVHQKIQEKDKTRIQIFEGIVLARKHGTEQGATFTVRRNTGGYGVEKIYPLYSPMIDKIEIVKRSKTRRAKLYHIREQALKQIKKRLKMMFIDISTKEDEEEVKPVEDQVAPASAEDSSEATPASVESFSEAKENTEAVEEKVETVEETKE